MYEIILYLFSHSLDMAVEYGVFDSVSECYQVRDHINKQEFFVDLYAECVQLKRG